MGNKAYFVMNIDERMTQDDGYYVEAIYELKAIPEVESVEPVFGDYDLVVKADDTVANKISAKSWVKRFHMLKTGTVTGAQAQAEKATPPPANETVTSAKGE